MAYESICRLTDTFYEYTTYVVRCYLIIQLVIYAIIYEITEERGFLIDFLLIVGKSFLCKEVATMRPQDDGLKQNYQRAYTS